MKMRIYTFLLLIVSTPLMAHELEAQTEQMQLSNADTALHIPVSHHRYRYYRGDYPLRYDNHAPDAYNRYPYSHRHYRYRNDVYAYPYEYRYDPYYRNHDNGDAAAAAIFGFMLGAFTASAIHDNDDQDSYYYYRHR